MCGIHGVFSVDSTYNSKAPKYMEQGFVAGSLRGMDSSGLFVVDKKGNVDTHKLALSGSNFIETKRVKGMVSDTAYAHIAVGHVRAATMGKVNADNAHPFVGWDAEGNKVIGVHNGTLTDWRSNVGSSLFDVDSEWAIQHIADENVDAFEDFTGAYCFIWWKETEPQKVYVARNDQRPMHFILTPDDKSMYLSSEAGMVAWLCDRNDIKAKDNKIMEIVAGQLYTFDLTGSEISWTRSALPAPIVKRTTYSQNMGYATGSGSSSYTGSTRATSFPHDGQEFVTKFNRIVDKEAVESAFVELTEEKVGSKKERRAAARAAEEKRKSDLIAAETEEYTLPDSYFHADGADPEEKQAAKSSGVYGQLEAFIPSHYEIETGDLYGEVEEWIKDTGGKIRHPAIIRNIKPRVANDLYMNGKKTPWCAVIGITTGHRRYVILGELSDEGDNVINKAV